MNPLSYKAIAREALILLAAALITALAVNSLSPHGIPLKGAWDTGKGVISADPGTGIAAQAREIKNIRTAKALFDSGKILFVDARSKESYAAGHIKGAVSLPLNRFEDDMGEFIERYLPDTPIVTYCSGRECEDSLRLARQLEEFGYSAVRVFIDGYQEWTARGYPVE